MSGHYLIVEARFYEDLLDSLAEGAIAALEDAGAYDGYVALGCVIRGETSHYDTVCNESARGIMELTIKDYLAIGNGIITVENSDQAWARARMSDKNKGGDAARAALNMAGLKAAFAEGGDDHD